MLNSIVALLALLSTPAPVAGRADRQDDAPLLVLKDLAGGEQHLGSYRGKVVVLNFWATWCAPCRKEMPLLVLLQRRHSAEGVQVIAASADDENTRGQIPEAVGKLKMNFPVWTGAKVEDMERLGLGSLLPATVFFDRDGRIAARIIGVLEQRDLEERVQWLLGNRLGPPPAPLINRSEESADAHGREDHIHSAVGLEGASSVPS